MYQYIAKYLVLNRVFKFFEKVTLPSLLIGITGFLLASYLAIYVLPADAEQKEFYINLFVLVTSAIMSELIYVFLAVN